MANEAKRIFNLCGTVANIFHPDNKKYAGSSQNLLFMIAAHESDSFKCRRQRGFPRDSYAGAFGLFQSEWPAMIDNLEWLGRKTQFHESIIEALRGYEGDTDTVALLTQMMTEEPRMRVEYKKEGIIASHSDPLVRGYRELSMTMEGDMFCAIMCRIHLMRQPGSIPAAPMAQSLYAKTYYNTNKGKATPALYLRAFSLWYGAALKDDAPITPKVPNPNSVFGCTSKHNEGETPDGTPSDR